MENYITDDILPENETLNPVSDLPENSDIGSDETVLSVSCEPGENAVTDEEAKDSGTLPVKTDENDFSENSNESYDRKYLYYGHEKLPNVLKLKDTKAFLYGMGIDGGELLQARKGKLLEDPENDNPNAQRCSYCGAVISGVDFFMLKDGRKRCSVCSNSLVKTEKQLMSIYNRIIRNMEVFWGVTINEEIKLEFIEEKKLKKKIGLSIGDSDDKSILILGCAQKKGGKYTVFVENSSPRISVMATLVHELTHIWQYINWDECRQKRFGFFIKKMFKWGISLKIYEGMAKWAEIQYLYLVGETKAAKREENYTLSRKDEYGVGFSLCSEEYPVERKQMTRNETPFSDKEFLGKMKEMIANSKDKYARSRKRGSKC